MDRNVQERKPRVLVVDDEALIRWSLGETLQERGYEVVGAGTAAEAARLTAAGQVPFDIILLDIRLPDSASLDVLEHLRRSSPSSRIIMMTAYGTPAIVERAERLGTVAFIGKPFKLADMVSAVESAT